MLWLFVLPLLGTSCSSEAGPEQETPAAFLVSVEGDASQQEAWGSLIDRRFAVQMDGIVKKYMVDAKGNLTSAEPFVWKGEARAQVVAWYPYNGGVKQEELLVEANQSIPALYQASNLMEAVNAEAGKDNAGLVFVHRVGKMVCALQEKPASAARDAGEAEGGIDFSGASVTLLNLKGVKQGNKIRMSDDFRAYMVAQVIPAGTEFMEVRLQDGRKFVHVMKEDFNPAEGIKYDMTVSIDPELGSIDLTIRESSQWAGEEEVLNPDSGTLQPGTGGSWGNGGGEDVNGSTGGANDPNAGSSWGNGGSEDVNGSTGNTTPGAGGGWGNSENEDVNGNVPTTTPGAGGSWSSEEESVTGEKEPETTNG